MLTMPENLPPFIHAHGCGLHFDPQATFQVDAHAKAQFSPLHPLANCISIAHMFNSRTANSVELVWRTIESERHRLVEEVREGFRATALLSLVYIHAVGGLGSSLY
jgi:hypothetical protein